MKIATIIGARPQFIKAAVVSRALCEHRADASEVLIHTGQHFDANMSDVFFDELELPRPDHHLGIGGGTHGQNTGRMIEAIETVLLAERPDWVLVYGDTDSTLAGTLAAVKRFVTQQPRLQSSRGVSWFAVDDAGAKARQPEEIGMPESRSRRPRQRISPPPNRPEPHWHLSGHHHRAIAEQCVRIDLAAPDDAPPEAVGAL